MTKKPKPASAKGWCVVTPKGKILLKSMSNNKSAAEVWAFWNCCTEKLHWLYRGYRVVRFTATEVVK
jgi:diadenosine tetraphosphate (Ap4A) HIT family hydrolase